MFSPAQFQTLQTNHAAAMFELTQKAFTSVEKIVELNLQTARSAFDEAAEATLAAKEPQQFFTPQVDALQPAAEKAATYGRELYDIVAEAQAEVNKFAEDGIAQARAQWLALVDTAVKNAPAGSETAASMFKSGVIAANDAFDNVQRASRQVAEGLQANLMAVAPKVAKTAKSAAKGKRA